MVQMRMEGFKKVAAEDLERVIEKDDSNSSMTTDSEDGKRLPQTFRDKLTHVLNTNKFQIVIICLVILDCLLVITELLIDLRVLEFHGSSPVPKVLHYISISIVSLFLIEIALKMYCLRQEFFKSKMEVFDALIVIVAFALNIAFANKDGLQSSVGLIIVLRLWRITRILNGIILSVKRQAERRLARERRVREALEQELAKYREYCNAQEMEIEALRSLLRKHGIGFGMVEKPIAGRTIHVVAEVNEVNEKLPLPPDIIETTESSA